jgi:NADPH:quinone reductase-like Zn-dependent oxidoreductase
MQLLPNWLAKRPHVAEHDFAGTIVDANGTQFAAGDEVYGWIQSRESNTTIRCAAAVQLLKPAPAGLQLKTSQGALAQYTHVPATHIVKRPQNVSALEAAGITLTVLTAYQGLIDIARIEPGQSVSINGGSSAVGTFAIQIAKAKGCTVIASCSAKNTELVKSFGADEVRAAHAFFAVS